MVKAKYRQETGPAGAILSLIDADGTASSIYAQSLRAPQASLRDLADAVHALCTVHGTFPGVVEQVGAGDCDGSARIWLTSAAARMAGERNFLVRLTAAVGPLPSTPGQGASQSAILAQRHALEMLVRSDRSGCAIGTALAFMLDWVAVRHILDGCASRVSLDTPGSFDEAEEEAVAALELIVTTPAVERAMAFGAQQMLAQHRGLWQLLKARSAARSAA